MSRSEEGKGIGAGQQGRMSRPRRTGQEMEAHPIRVGNSSIACVEAPASNHRRCSVRQIPNTFRGYTRRLGPRYRFVELTEMRTDPERHRLVYAHTNDTTPDYQRKMTAPTR